MSACGRVRVCGKMRMNEEGRSEGDSSDCISIIRGPIPWAGCSTWWSGVSFGALIAKLLEKGGGSSRKAGPTATRTGAFDPKLCIYFCFQLCKLCNKTHLCNAFFASFGNQLA